jgi:hypothetical protein
MLAELIGSRSTFTSEHLQSRQATIIFRHGSNYSSSSQKSLPQHPLLNFIAKLLIAVFPRLIGTGNLLLLNSQSHGSNARDQATQHLSDDD